jgi:hypothetical protein
MTTLDINTDTLNGLPRWLAVMDGGVTITLSTPATLSGVKVEKLTLRTPTVRDLRTCQKMHPNDLLAVDAMLFSSLASITETELLSLSLKDYERVKSGYFRMVEEDEL